jgi:hypothetical protein
MTIDKLKQKIKYFVTYDAPKLKGDCEIEHGINYFVKELLNEINTINLAECENNIIFGDIVSMKNDSITILLQKFY